MHKTQFCGYICGIITAYQQILIILDNFEIIFIGALFPSGTDVAGTIHEFNPENLLIFKAPRWDDLQVQSVTPTFQILQMIKRWRKKIQFFLRAILFLREHKTGKRLNPFACARPTKALFFSSCLCCKYRSHRAFDMLFTISNLKYRLINTTPFKIPLDGCKQTEICKKSYDMYSRYFCYVKPHC